MPAARRRISRELFETRSHSWHEVGLGSELEPVPPRRLPSGLLAALVVIAGAFVVYHNREAWLPGYAPWVRIGTALALAIAGSAAVHWLVRSASPRLFRHLPPATPARSAF